MGKGRSHPQSVSLHPPQPQHAGPRRLFAPQRRPRGVPGVVRVEGAQTTLDRLIRVDQLVPFALPHFEDCVTPSEQSHAFG